MTAVAIDERRIRTRFHMDGPLVPGAEIDLPEDRAHQLSRVLRAKTGEAVLLFNADAGEVLAEIAALDRRRATTRILQALRPPMDPSTATDVRLLPALVKKGAFETQMRQAVELGVSHLCPVLTEHGERDTLNRRRLESQILEAVEQCERLDVPKLDDPRPLSELISEIPPDRTIIACVETGAGLPLAEVLSETPQEHSISVLIGPEGGFSRAERVRLRETRNVRSASLGPLILKADTAAAAALGIVQAMRGTRACPPHRPD